mmetsp:Transcript_10796/g.13662  ORF Transcript_10796/g.13662 Transcript_10796/m.13662 type:complete len:221 (-) Transcript_10796:84-746(-)
MSAALSNPPPPRPLISILEESLLDPDPLPLPAAVSPSFPEAFLDLEPDADAADGLSSPFAAAAASAESAMYILILTQFSSSKFPSSLSCIQKKNLRSDTLPYCNKYTRSLSLPVSTLLYVQSSSGKIVRESTMARVRRSRHSILSSPEEAEEEEDCVQLTSIVPRRGSAVTMYRPSSCLSAFILPALKLINVFGSASRRLGTAPAPPNMANSSAFIVVVC